MATPAATAHHREAQAAVLSSGKKISRQSERQIFVVFRLFVTSLPPIGWVIVLDVGLPHSLKGTRHLSYVRHHLFKRSSYSTINGRLDERLQGLAQAVLQILLYSGGNFENGSFLANRLLVEGVFFEKWEYSLVELDRHENPP
jgi:hypothetical protein